MKPVADSLDKLQGEENTFTGGGNTYYRIILPTLHIMKTLLIRKRDQDALEYAKPLAEALLAAFEGRFGHLYQDENALIATAIHPHYTPAMLRVIASDEMQETIIKRIVQELTFVKGI